VLRADVSNGMRQEHDLEHVLAGVGEQAYGGIFSRYAISRGPSILCVSS
jgi:hypothetical protein